MESPISIKEKSVGSPIIEDSLLSMEQLDRTSPELWPEQLPGMAEYTTNNSHNTATYGKMPAWMKGLDSEDMSFMIYLSKLTPAGLVAEVKKLYDTAYQLGVEESKEMTRGRYLKVLLKPRKDDPADKGDKGDQGDQEDQGDQGD